MIKLKPNSFYRSRKSGFILTAADWSHDTKSRLFTIAFHELEEVYLDTKTGLWNKT